MQAEESARYEKPTTIGGKIWDWLSKYLYVGQVILPDIFFPNSVKIVLYYSLSVQCDVHGFVVHTYYNRLLFIYILSRVCLKAVLLV